METKRLSLSKKNANDKAWYKEQANLLDGSHFTMRKGNDGIDIQKKMKVNYDLFNDKLDLEEFKYVCNPYGNDIGELPANMVNRDIVSGKVKAMLGMEKKRPFAWNVLATNREATTRKEQEEFGRLKDYVVNSIVQPIREQIEIQKMEETEGRELTPEEQARIQEEIEQEFQTQTPEEVKKYMMREHQDPAEVMSSQLMRYLMQKLNVEKKFNDIFKHGLLSAKEVGYVGVLNGEPQFWRVNPMRFDCNLSPDSEFIEDGESATCEYRMSPSDVIAFFGKELTNKEIDLIYESWNSKGRHNDEGDLFTLVDDGKNSQDSYISVLHCVWKSLRKIGFLTYIDEETGQEEETLVDEDYELNTDFGDIKIEWEWIPEVYETWKIKVSKPIYVYMRPLPGQFKDLDNLYYCKLPYYGIYYDNMNSEPTSLMDRLRPYQYFYNIIWYRFELLLASDKGKKVMMNIGAIPTSSGIDLEKWQYFFESTPFMYYDPHEEGSGYQDANTLAKVIDLSVASDIQKYIQVLEYLRQQAGRSVGITDHIEGQTAPNEAVSNAQQNLVQSSYILEMYFEMHNHVKRNIFQALIETAKVAYADNKPKKLSYFLDDMSMHMFELDMDLIDNSTLGIFVANSTKAEETKEVLKQLTHAAMQNQKVELSDVLSVLRQDDMTEAEEILKVAEQNRQEFEQGMQREQQEAMAEQAEREREFLREAHEMEKEKIVLKEEERRKTVIAQAALTGLSFNPELDQDKDGVPDFLELAKHGLDADIKKSKHQLEREKFEHQKTVDEQRIQNENKKLAIEQAKNQQKSVKP